MIKNICVAQSGGPTAAINSSLCGVLRACNQNKVNLLGARYGIDGVLKGEFVNLNNLVNDVFKELLLIHTPSSYLGSCRHKLANEEELDKIFNNFEKNNIDAFIYIGGNDSMDTVNKLSEYANKTGSSVKIIGAPKTIDNDLVLCDHTPGYGSAARFIATTCAEVAADSSVYDMKSATVIEIMGRDTGWLTAASALASNFYENISLPHLILLPEVELDTEQFLSAVSDSMDAHGNVIIAASEGVHTHERGNLFYTDGGSTDAFGHPSMQSGVSRTLANLISNEIGCKTRAIELSTLQRSASHCSSSTDLEEANTVGYFAVKTALDGMSGVVPMLKRKQTKTYKTSISYIRAKSVANKIRYLPQEMITSNFGVTQEFIDYATPLIGDEPLPKINLNVR